LVIHTTIDFTESLQVEAPRPVRSFSEKYPLKFLDALGRERVWFVPRLIVTELECTGATQLKNTKPETLALRRLEAYYKADMPPIPTEVVVALAKHADATGRTQYVSRDPYEFYVSKYFPVWMTVGMCYRAFTLRYLGRTPPAFEPALFTESVGSMSKAIDARVLKPRNLTTQQLWDEVTTHLTGQLGFDYVSTMGADEFLADEHLTSSMRKMYRDKCGYDGELLPDPSVHVPTYKDNAKVEFLGSLEGLKKQPRVISAPDTMTKVLLGMFTYPCSKALAKHHGVGSGSRFSYASGCSESEVGQWFDSALSAGFGAYCVEVDYSKWDSTLGPEALTSEFGVWRYLGCDEGRLRLFQRTITAPHRVTSARTLFAMVKPGGGRHSGDPNTSVGNSVLNLSIQVFYFDNIVGIDNYRAIVLGDDFLCLLNPLGRQYYIEARGDEAYVQYTKNLGLNPEMSANHHPKYSSFCSRYFWPCIQGGKRVHVLGAKLGRALTKLGWFVSAKADNATYLAQLLQFRPTWRVIPLLRLIIESEISDLHCAGVSADLEMGPACDYKLHGVTGEDLTFDEGSLVLFNTMYSADETTCFHQWLVGGHAKEQLLRMLRAAEHET
jgi:hypothetical protein